MRRSYNYFKITGIGGIDQQEGLGDPATTLSDARNVWSPHGKLIRRPAYWGSAFVGISISSSTAAQLTSEVGSTGVQVTADPLVLTGFGDGDYWYVGFSSLNTGSVNPGVIIEPVSANANNLVGIPYYWNGLSWLPLAGATEFLTDDSGTKTYVSIASSHLSSVGGFGGSAVLGLPGKDWVPRTVNGGSSLYFIRFRLQNAGAATLTAGTSVQKSGTKIQFSSSTLVGSYKGLFLVKFATSKQYILNVFVASKALESVITGTKLDALGAAPEPLGNLTVGIFPTAYSLASPPNNFPPPQGSLDPRSIAVVSDFNEAYFSRGDLTLLIVPGNVNPVVAQVESNPYIVGPTDTLPSGTTVPYPKDPSILGYVSQLATWPAAKYIEYFRGEMWAASLNGEGPNAVRWSAPQPYYKVWPTNNLEFLIENDNSPITAIRGFQQNMTIFKQHSIWRMVDAGISSSNLQLYAPERVINGVGCVSQSSIADVQNNLIFLAEDGIYKYDGTTQIAKLSNRIYKTIASINPSRRPFSCGVNWSSQNLYLLSVAVNGSDRNNLVIVWDYKNDTWWLWDDIEAQSWLLDTDVSGLQRLYFVDGFGRVYEMDIGDTDHGNVIVPYIETQRLAEDGFTRKLHVVEVHGTNADRNLQISVARNDEPFDQITPATLSMKDSLEKDWSNLVFGTDNYSPERHRYKKALYLKSGEYFRLKVAGTGTEPQNFELHDINVGFTMEGRRR